MVDSSSGPLIYTAADFTSGIFALATFESEFGLLPETLADSDFGGQAMAHARLACQERLEWVRQSYERFIEKVLELELDGLKPIALQSIL